MAAKKSSPSRAPKAASAAQADAPAVPLALYRRYRPATFAEVKGQDHVTEPLRQALRSGRVHHAYLFSGPRGCGKTSSARILARSLNCENGPTPDPCGKCASCVALAPAGPGSIDVIEIDAASHGGVDDARDLRERAFYAPVTGRFKIYIIDEAHMVTGGGFNALLKLVEEPPPHLKFVFATTEPEKVIATIRSRTHHYPFRLVPPAVLRELLEQILGSEGVAYEPAVLPVVIRAGAGSARDSLSILDQLIAGSGESGLSYERAVALLGYTDDALLDDVVDAFAAGDGAAVFYAIDRVIEGGRDPRRFAADLLDRLRDLIVLAAVPDALSSGLLDVPADRQERMREQASRFGQARLASAAQAISTGLVEMRGATSPRLLLELMCAQVLLPDSGAADKDVLARLERLERRLGPGGGTGGGTNGGGPGLEAAARAAGQRGPGDRRPGPDRGPQPGRGPGPAPDRGSGPDRGATADPGAPAQPRAGSRQAAGPGDDDPAPAGPAADARRDRQDAGRPAAGKAVDAVHLREQWPAVLDAVRREGRVAWILLSNAAIDSLAEGVLTLKFAKEGEARGFAISGHDRELGQVLQAMFGITPQIRAVSAAQGAVAQARPAPGSAPRDRARPDAGARRGAPGAPGAPGDDPRDSSVAGPDAARRPAGGRETERAGGASARSGSAMSQGGRDFPGAEDAVESDASALSGVDLIERELGGRVIDETGED